jgi:hypothetical protein
MEIGDFERPWTEAFSMPTRHPPLAGSFNLQDSRSALTRYVASLPLTSRQRLD